jgi:hypothetical protein
MCYYITAALAPGGDADAVREIAGRHLLLWEPIANPSVTRQLGKGYTYYFTTRGMCDCSTEMGEHWRIDQRAQNRNFEKKVGKLQRSGWSAPKIERWLADQKSVAERKRKQQEQHKLVEGPEIRRWIDFFTEVLTKRRAASVGILLHFYNRAIDGENIQFAEHKLMPLAALTLSDLYNLPDDVFLEVSISGRQPPSRH